jgi:hypothetical protein
MAAKRPANRVETLPSGIEVAFWDAVGVDGKGQRRCYRVDGREETWPSISTITGVFDKPALMPAAVKLQEEAVIELAKRGVDIASLTQDELRSELWAAELHYDAVWKVARDRGDVAHDMLLALVRDGVVPNLGDYPEDLRPWISAGMKWVHRERPEVIDAEYFVASLTYKFAGRGDLLCRLRDDRIARVDYKTVSRWSREKPRKGEEIGRLRAPYDENLIALAGYELAAPESGYEPADVKMIVRLGPDGEYDVTESHATEDVFLAALTAYREKKYLATGRPEAVAV